jgi:hypothetical protein
MIISGPEGIKYKTGRRTVIYYNPENPEDNCIFTFASLYLSFNRKAPTSLNP